MSEHVFAAQSRREHFHNRIFQLVSEDVQMPGGSLATRDFISGHIGAVGAVPYDEAGDAVLLIRQYRHPLGRELWELPAGLLDVAGEPALASAQRELAEEVDLHADRWSVLVDLAVSPGCSDEMIRIFLARGLTVIPLAQRHHRTDEEAVMISEWMALDDAVGRALAGQIENAACVAGLLATVRARDNGWGGLRPADAPWPHGPTSVR